MIFGLIIIALLAIYPASNIRTDFNLEGFYPQNDDVLLDYHVLEDEFGRDDNTILIGFQEDSLFTIDVLTDLYHITEQLMMVENLDDVLSLWSADKIDSNNNTLYFNPYLSFSELGDADLSFLKDQMRSDPILGGFLLNQSGDATAIALRIDESNNNYPVRNQIIDSINEILDEYRPKYQFHISGIPYFRNQYVNMLNSEIINYILISSLLIVLLLYYLYRTIWGVLFPMIIVWTTLLLTVAMIHLSGGYLEIMSSTIAPILLCVGVADAVHMISKYDDARELGKNKHFSIIEMIVTLGSATFLTSITTAIGFASLISSTVVPMKMFGIYTAMGVLLAYIITILFLPAVLRLSGKNRVVNEKSGSFYPAINRTLHKLSVINRRHYVKILVSGSILTLLFSFGLTKLNVNGKIFDDIGEDTVLMQDSRFFSEYISSQFPLEFIIDTGEQDGVFSIELMKKLVRFEEFLLSYPEIQRVTGLHTLITEVHRSMSDSEDDLFNPIPENDSAIAQYVLLLELNGSDELFRLVDFDYSKLRITSFTDDAGSNRINQIRDELQPVINNLFPEKNVITTGTTILSADLTEKIVYSLAWSILLAVSAITVIMAFLFKNIRLLLIALIPNVIPLIIVAGLMGYMSVDIKPSTAVIFTIALGIAVDDSIHFLARFRIEYLRKRSMNPAISFTTIRTGRAIVITSLILIAGFGTLMTSAFTSTALMGFLVCTTIFAALLADLLILPSLFYWLKPDLQGLTKF
ncbi:MAG: MMPL family transporter [Balneolaceae bacterium]